MFKNLETDRTKLTKINESALYDMFEYSKNSLLYKYLEFKPHKLLDDTRKYLQKLIKRCEEGNAHYWLIRLKNNNKLIGTFGVLNIDLRKMDAEIGYGLSPEYWNQGYFKEVLKAVLIFLFEEKNFHRIWATTQSDNVPSIKGLKSVGFVEEGLLREHYYSFDGKRHDAKILSILLREYNE